ncbi:MAG: hypothetical protein ACRDQ2_02625 [Gaiellales bacterium]
MSARAPVSHPAVTDGADVVVEVDVRGRWDALALSEALIPFHSFLVQHSAHRWVVHARSPGCHGEPLADALAAIDQWQDERALEAAVRIDGQPQGRPR